MNRSITQPKKKLFGILCLIALSLSLLVVASACSSSSNPEGVQETSDSRVTYEGKILSVALKENGSTGYIWEITKEGAGLAELDDEYVSDVAEDEQVAGAGGVHTYRFEGEAEGTTTLDFLYSQPWDPKDTDEKLKIEVKTQTDGTIEEVKVS